MSFILKSSYGEHAHGAAVNLADVRKVTGTEFKQDAGRVSSDEAPCVFCNRTIRTKGSERTYVRSHLGTTDVCVTEDELERLNAAGFSGADMGCYPIGSDCLRKVCKLVPDFRDRFVITMEG